MATLIDPRLGTNSEARLLRSDLSDAQIKQCEDYTTVMEVMYDTTVAISSESMPTVGLILPIQAKLLCHFSPMADDSAFLKTVKKAIHDDLIKRYQAPEVRSFLEEVGAMDPRTKLRWCIPSDAWDRIKEKLVEHFTETAVAVKCEPEAEPESALTSKVKSMEVKAEPGTESQSPLPKKIKFDWVLCDDDDDIEIVSSYVLSPVQMAEQELHKCKLMPKLPSDGNPLSFWKGQAMALPALSLLASKFLVVQATSVPSEMVFSTAGDIVSAEHTCLDPEQVDALIFLKKNMEH